jgi:hypothetical protein
MPETRYVNVYQDGVLIDQEPYEVSDAELRVEAYEALVNTFEPGGPFTNPGVPESIAALKARVIALEDVVAALIRLKF